jgi:hypothetical protein
MGDDYLSWLQRWDGNDVKGNTDLAARFLLRADRLLSLRGQLGYVTTNTIIEGATLRVGLDQVSFLMRAGRSPHAWPTKSANLQIVELWGSKVPLAKEAVHWLDGDEVPNLGSDLQPYLRVQGRPKRLYENESISFNGSKIEGLGFTLTRNRKMTSLRTTRATRKSSSRRAQPRTRHHNRQQRYHAGPRPHWTGVCQ